MATPFFKSNELNAKNLKMDLKSIGVKVLRARQNKNGVLLTVASSSVDKVNEYLNTQNMGTYAGVINDEEAGKASYIDYGTVYKWVKAVNA